MEPHNRRRCSRAAKIVQRTFALHPDSPIVNILPHLLFLNLLRVKLQTSSSFIPKCFQCLFPQNKNSLLYSHSALSNSENLTMIHYYCLLYSLYSNLTNCFCNFMANPSPHLLQSRTYSKIIQGIQSSWCLFSPLI